ncbi:MAG: hypothetical protein HY832_00005 [Candidatus Aenigmarchaeota archaeon]|nr:hypothetical protein [Candidatus Aenigmarchaeota archaeon]
MLFFGKKPTPTSPPYDEVQRMTAKGMSDKDIIKKLKGKGYSYEQIEKAMLQAVKGGVEEMPLPTQQQQMPRQTQQESFDNFYTAPSQQSQQDVFAESSPELPDFSSMEEMGEQEGDPEAMIEELIEGVVEDKWKRFDDQIRKLEDDIVKMRVDLKNATMRFETASSKEPSREQESHVQELAEQMDELDARIGGLEKAFKQFLPSLTRNIESLSNMIHEMKGKQGMTLERDLV